MPSARPDLRARLSIVFTGLLTLLLLAASPTRSQSFPGFSCSSTEAESTFDSELRSGTDERTYSLRTLSNPVENKVKQPEIVQNAFKATLKGTLPSEKDPTRGLAFIKSPPATWTWSPMSARRSCSTGSPSRNSAAGR